MITDAKILEYKAALTRLNRFVEQADPSAAACAAVDDVQLLNEAMGVLLHEIDELRGLVPRKTSEPKWCASLDSTAAEETYGPWDSREEAIAGVTAIRDQHDHRDTHAFLGRVETACPVAHGGVSFSTVCEWIEENATEETFHWVEDDVFPKPESLEPVDREFEALLRRHLKSPKWAMADAGQETVELDAGVGF